MAIKIPQMQSFVQSFYNRHRAATIVQSFFVLHFDESTLDYPHRKKSHFPSGLKSDFQVYSSLCQGSFNCEAEDRQYFCGPLGDNYDIQLFSAPLRAGQTLDWNFRFSFAL